MIEDVSQGRDLQEKGKKLDGWGALASLQESRLARTLALQVGGLARELEGERPSTDIAIWP